MITRVRPPAQAGRFYPADADELAREVDRHLATAGAPVGAAAPKALIAPHAGYVYSGPVAASAYRELQGRSDHVRTVVLLGPNHTVALRAMAVSTADHWRTPLGSVPVAQGLRELVAGVAGVVLDDRPHVAEHAIEVHLPFLQRVLPPGFELLPVVVGHCPPDAVADLLDLVWGGPETLIVVSTDLSHFHDHATAESLDHATAGAIVGLDVAEVSSDRACGAHPVRGLLVAAARHGLVPRLVDLRTSGDTAGGRDRVVGYGSFTLDAAATGATR